MEIGQIIPDLRRENQKARIDLPIGRGLVEKVMAIFSCGNSRDLGLQKDVLSRLGDKAENGEQGPSQDACLAPGKRRNPGPPDDESFFRRAGTVKEGVKSFREALGPGGRFEGVAESHLFEGEKKICARLDADGVTRDFFVPSRPK